MNSEKVCIIDSGIGNIFSLCNAIEYIGGIPEVLTIPEKILNYDKLIIPGVGAFPMVMGALKERNLIGAIKQYVNYGRPVLGICVGMQILFDSSEEFGFHKGLGLIRGNITKLTSKKPGIDIKTPHVGWAALKFRTHIKNNYLFQDVSDNDTVYFVHSYSANPSNITNILAEANYEDLAIAASVQSENIFGCQFHPEKSGKVGLKILSNFLTLT